MKYWSKVRVTSWFYEGLEWYLKVEFTKFFTKRKEYLVEIYLPDGNPISTTLQFIPESNLEIIN